MGSNKLIKKIQFLLAQNWTVYVLIMGLLHGITNETLAQTNQDWPLWRSLVQGEYSVGFKIINASVADDNVQSRIVRIAMWYPAPSNNEVDRMEFKDYLEIQPDTIPDPAFEAWMNQRDRESLSRQFFDTEAESRQAALMRAPIPIQVHAPNEDGAFPLIVHSLGRNGNQFQHTILWEYLASHGYVVVSIGQYGKNQRDPTMAFSYKDLSYQLRDMQRSIAWLDQLSFVDTRKIGLLGHSSGAVVSLWLASRDIRVQAVVGLDGSMNRAENQKVLHKGMVEENRAIPILNICRWPHEEYFDDWTDLFQGEMTRVGYERAIHFDFQNWPAYQAFAGGQEPSSLTFRSLDEAETVFVSTTKITKLFLDAHIKSDAVAKKEIRNPESIRALSKGQASLNVYPVIKH